MTILWSVIGLVAFFKGKIYFKNGYRIEGNIAKVIGLTIFFLDVTPLLCILSSMITPVLMSNIGIYTLFGSFILNMLIWAFADMFFARRLPEE